MVSRSHKDKDDGTHHSSHTTFASLTTPEKTKRLQSLRKENNRLKNIVHRMEQKIADSADASGVVVDDDLHDHLKRTVKDCADRVHMDYPEGSFQRLFFEQQHKASSQKNPKSMRWHPIFVKWCLYLRHLSGKAYEVLRNSGCIYLPSQRTLRDYTHYISANMGFSADTDLQLVDVAKIDEPLNRYVILVLDEMHIKEDLVFDKHEGSLIGFANLGNMNNHLLQFEASLQNDTHQEQLAKTMLVFMVRGLFGRLNFPYVQFACANLTGELILQPLWEAISRLERQGFKVLGLTCDGASSNRRLWTLHQEIKRHVMKKKSIGTDHDDKGNEDIFYKVPNVFAADSRDFYFFSDPPHLIKTARNCWASKARHLWVSSIKQKWYLYACTFQRNGKQISWKHLEDLYLQETRKESSGLRLIPKIKYEHVYLSSFSKMRVDLAAQVLKHIYGCIHTYIRTLGFQ